MNKFYFFTVFLLFCVPNVFSQKLYTVSGYVKDNSTGETLIGASVSENTKNVHAQTNAYGFFSITLPEGDNEIVVNVLGYNENALKVNLNADIRHDFNLEISGQELTTVIVTDTRKDANVDNTDMGKNTLSVEKIKKLPVIFGESDVLKAIQLLPGVQSAGEASSGFYVRGGGPDQNLVLLDEAIVYNTGHLFGFFSIFNSDAIKNVTLIKGGMPAQYGGRLSSVLDVTMKDGNNKKFAGEGGLGLIASRLTLEGPIVKEKGSFIVSARRTYIDVITKPFLPEERKGSGYYFYDANIKANYTLSSKDRIFLSGYFGRDVFSFKSSSGNFKVDIPWGNATSTLRWNRQWSPKVFMNTTAIFNDYKFTFNAKQQLFNIKFYSAIRDLGAKLDFDYYHSNNHKIKFGAQFTNHTFIPNQFSGQSDTMKFEPNNALRKKANELGIFAQDEFNIGPFVKINLGMRYSWFGQLGPYTYYQQSNNVIIDSTIYNEGDLVQSYGGLEPRINGRFKINNNTSIKASVSRSIQYLHLVSNNGSTLPTDIWVPSTKIVQPQKSWQYSIGYFQNFLDNMVETSVELYYKDMRNQVEYRNGYTPNSLRDPELDFTFGRGYAYGAEFFINKTKGKFTGWIGYTLAWTWRQFPALNDGVKFPAKYDRRHDLSVVATYEFNPKITLSGVFIYGTGNAITLPTSYYFVDNQLVQNFSAINQYRIFPYHRADLSLVWTPSGDKPKKLKSSWNVSVYNAYNRMNPYFLFVDQVGDLNTGTQVKVKQVSVFPIIPSITWNFKF